MRMSPAAAAASSPPPAVAIAATGAPVIGSSPLAWQPLQPPQLGLQLPLRDQLFDLLCCLLRWCCLPCCPWDWDWL
nr:hypothetical protein [Microtetraspora sp. AC03309]